MAVSRWMFAASASAAALLRAASLSKRAARQRRLSLLVSSCMTPMRRMVIESAPMR